MPVNNTAPTLWLFAILLPFTAFILWQASRSDPSVPAAVPEVDLHAARVEEAANGMPGGVRAGDCWHKTFLPEYLAGLEEAGMITILWAEEKRCAL